MATAVTVIGDALLDVHAVPSRPPQPARDVPAEIRLEPGGQGANVAVRLARQGLRVRLVCAIGADAAGNLLRERLSADGVELVDLGAPATGAVVVLLDAGRERTMLSQRVPLADRLTAAALADTGWLVVSGYVLLEPAAGVSASSDAPRRALLGCSLDASEVDDWLAGAASLAPHLIVLNEGEASVLTDSVGAPGALALRVAELLGAIAVVTHPAGAACAGLDAFEVHGRTSVPVVDTTGAGDAFAAGLIAGLVDEPWPPEQAALEDATGSAALLAASVALVHGAQGVVPGEAGW